MKRRRGGEYSREARQGASFFGFIPGEKLYNWWRKYIVEKVILTVNMPRVGIKGYERIGFEKNRASKVKLMCGARGEFPSGSWNGAMKLTPGEEVHRRKESKRRMRHRFKIIPPSFQRDTTTCNDGKIFIRF